IMTGGSGLYVNAVLNGFDPLPFSPETREALNMQFQNEGLDPLIAQLEKLDPEFASQMDNSNSQRVIRALEVCLVSNQPYSSLRSQSRKTRPFDMINFGLDAPRPWIYERINTRVDIMMREGLLEEVKQLESFKGLNSLKTVGYSELFAHLEGSCSLDEAVEQIKMNTRRFSKRQLTWFRNKLEVQWLDAIDISQNMQSGIDQIQLQIEAIQAQQE
ncbi:MAG: tRNA (adenosine(37)-N6)-dimethylallyltransferase MiaA, partial [Flavobacteriales bacterium]